MVELKATYITTKFLLNLRGNINGPYVVCSLCCVCAHLCMSVHASTHIYQ